MTFITEARTRLSLLGTIASVPLCLAACATTPQTQASASTQAAPAEQVAATTGERKICRDVSTTGSYGPRHECHTSSEWKKIDELS